MKEFERNIEKNKFDKIILNSSLGAVKFYERNNYFYKKYTAEKLADGYYLCFLVMEKDISEKGENNNG